LPDRLDGLRDFLQVLDYPAEVRNQILLGGRAPARSRGLFSPAFADAVTGLEPYDAIDAALEGCESADARDRTIYRYCKLYLAGQNLANADRASMAAALELRAPLLGHNFVEFTARIPAQLRASACRSTCGCAARSGPPPRRCSTPIASGAGASSIRPPPAGSSPSISRGGTTRGSSGPSSSSRAGAPTT